ncbi:MAG: hypothetical protein IKA36_01820 [Clostridia bacterium]|nr:hypothetical protein [Clostridia bacterium]
MDKKLNRSKTFVLCIAIIMAILTFFIAFFGLLYKEQNNKTKSGESIEIWSESDLNNFAARVNRGEDLAEASVVLRTDLDFSTTSFTQIGTKESPFFYGQFDGDKHRIKNLDKALFAYTDSSWIYNIILDGCASESDSLLVDASKNTTILNIMVYDSSVTATNDYHKANYFGVGALVGEAIGGIMIYNCGVNANISADKVAQIQNVGGLVGNVVDSAYIDSCYFRGDITFRTIHTVYFGGLAGGKGNVSAEKNYVYISGGKIEGYYYVTTQNFIDSPFSIAYYHAAPFVCNKFAKDIEGNGNRIGIHEDVECIYYEGSHVPYFASGLTKNELKLKDHLGTGSEDLI